MERKTWLKTQARGCCFKCRLLQLQLALLLAFSSKTVSLQKRKTIKELPPDHAAVYKLWL